MSERPGRRWLRALLVVLVLVAVVFVLFTWVFPWITELGLSPAMD